MRGPDCGCAPPAPGLWMVRYSTCSIADGVRGLSFAFCACSGFTAMSSPSWIALDKLPAACTSWVAYAFPQDVYLAAASSTVWRVRHHSRVWGHVFTTAIYCCQTTSAILYVLFPAIWGTANRVSTQPAGFVFFTLLMHNSLALYCGLRITGATVQVLAAHMHGLEVPGAEQ